MPTGRSAQHRRRDLEGKGGPLDTRDRGARGLSRRSSPIAARCRRWTPQRVSGLAAARAMSGNSPPKWRHAGAPAEPGGRSRDARNAAVSSPRSSQPGAPGRTGPGPGRGAELHQPGVAAHAPATATGGAPAPAAASPDGPQQRRSAARSRRRPMTPFTPCDEARTGRSVRSSSAASRCCSRELKAGRAGGDDKRQRQGDGRLDIFTACYAAVATATSGTRWSGHSSAWPRSRAIPPSTTGSATPS